MLIVIREGGITTAERTVIDGGQSDKVRDFRAAVDEETAPSLAQQIGEIVGRPVRSHCSQVMFEPDRMIDIYALGDPDAPQVDSA